MRTLPSRTMSPPQLKGTDYSVGVKAFTVTPAVMPERVRRRRCLSVVRGSSAGEESSVRRRLHSHWPVLAQQGSFQRLRV